MNKKIVRFLCFQINSNKILNKNIIKDYEIIHQIACNNKNETYKDPITGYIVITSFGHLKRGKCCGNKCRHCPYNHINVKKIEN